MSQALENARRFEEEKDKAIRPEDRPAFHLSSRVGWMNDPNGFSYYNGLYHMFYQYHPYDSHWGPMHWGHAVSKDLIKWEYLPAALAPDEPYDAGGCFSGSAITLPAETAHTLMSRVKGQDHLTGESPAVSCEEPGEAVHVLMYTGIMTEEADGETKELQTQNLAFGNGFEYKKYAGNPILTENDLPEGGSRYDFRDPRIWQAPDGTFRALIANDFEQESEMILSGLTGEPIEGLDEGGRMLLYRSDDLVHWSFVRVFAENHGRMGLMWECPDFFELDGRAILIGSAQDMLSQGLEYHNGNGTFCLLGKYDPGTETFTEEDNQAIDYGIDFYAPQTIQTPDGRRVMIGWMQNWDTCNLHTPSIPWFGQMSLPRELSVRNGILYQQPLRELEQYRQDPVTHEHVTVQDDEISLPGIKGRTLDLTLEIDPCEGDLFDRFAIHFAKNENYHTGVSFRPRESILKVDRKFSGSRRAIIHQRRAKVRHEQGALKLRLILDRRSVEVFVNDGEKVMTATFDTDLSADQITFFAHGKVTFSVASYALKF